jgi:tetratricopeptide (TPR) repeat protein
MAEPEDSINKLAERLDVLRGEVDALQLAAMQKATPWYKNASSLVALLALLFSFGTTLVSYNHTRAQDIQALRSDLRSLVQRLASLPKENLEIMKKYADDPMSINLVGGYINQENTMLARQAAEIVRRLPADQVSSTEYQSIALALQNSYDNAGAAALYEKAIETAGGLNDEVAALRGRANCLFISGKPEAGRQEYQKALAIFSHYPGYNDYVQVSTNVWTELSWAFSEAGNAELTGEHIARADALVSKLPPGPGTDQLRGQINQAKVKTNTR